MLADRQRVPGPGGAAVVVVADLLARQAGRVGERRRQLDHRRGLGERLGEVDDLHVAARECVDQGGDLACLGAGHVGGSLGYPARKASSSHSAQIVGFTFASRTSGPCGLASHSSTTARSSVLRTVADLRAGRRGDRREIGVGEAHERDVVSHRLEVVDLGAVGRVVVDQDEQRQLQTRRGLELGRAPGTCRRRRAPPPSGRRAARSRRRSRCRGRARPPGSRSRTPRRAGPGRRGTSTGSR